MFNYSRSILNRGHLSSLMFFYIYKVNDSRGNPDKPSFIFKMGAVKARIDINMDRNGEHYLKEEYCSFDEKRKRCRGFVTLTASVTMEATAEDTINIELF